MGLRGGLGGAFKRLRIYSSLLSMDFYVKSESQCPCGCREETTIYVCELHKCKKLEDLKDEYSRKECELKLLDEKIKHQLTKITYPPKTH